MYRSILALMAGRAGSMLASFLSVPILLHLMGTAQYGAWVTLTSVLNWFLIFDFGITNALKNRVAEASVRQNEDKTLAAMIAGSIQIYCVVAVVILTAVGLATLWIEPFKSYPRESLTLFALALSVFPVSMSPAVLQANGRFMASSLLLLPLPLCWLLACSALLLLSGTLTMTRAALIYGGLYAIQAVLIAYVALSSSIDWRALFDWRNVRQAAAVVKIGLRFFALQLSTLVLFSLGNFYCYQKLPSEQVAQFDTINKIFMLFSTALTITTTVLWTEASKAKALGDSGRLLSLQHRFLLFTAVMTIGAAIAVLNLEWAVRLLSHGQLDVSGLTLWPFALLASIQSLAFSGAVFLNVFERINGQLALGVLAVPSFLLLSEYFFAHGWSVSAVPLATSLALVPTTVYCAISSRRTITTLR